MKLLELADDDGVRHELTAQPADLVLSLGDVADLVILEAAKQAQCGRIFAVKGNHDSGGAFPAGNGAGDGGEFQYPAQGELGERHAGWNERFQLLHGLQARVEIDAGKSFTPVKCLAVALAILAVLLWPRLHDSRRSIPACATTMQFSGTAGAAFSGEYVQDGKRVAISGVLPWSLTVSNISRLEVLKAKAEDTLVVDARGGGSMVSAPSGPDSKGIRLDTEGGWSVEFIR